MDAIIAVGLTLMGIAGTQYALGILLRMKNVYMPLTAEIAQKAQLPKDLYTKLKVDKVMSIIMLPLMPFLVYCFGGQPWHVLAYILGAVCSVFSLLGKCGRDDKNTRLYFYLYRPYLKNISALYDDPAYHPYITYRHRSMIERALDEEEKRHRQEE